MFSFIAHFRFSKRDRDATNYERRVEALEAQVAELQAKLNEVEAPRRRLEKENHVSVLVIYRVLNVFILVHCLKCALIKKYN